MSEIQSIAILGATGRLGTQLLAALARHPRHKSLDIRVLTRPSPWPTEVDPSLRVTVYPIQYGTPGTHESLLRALRGVDIVISTVGDDSGLSGKDVKSIAELPGFRAQDVVAKAAKAAGVKFFVPSEFGYPTHTLPDEPKSFMSGKKRHLDLLRSIGLPWVVLYSGTFPSFEPIPTMLPSMNDSVSKGSPPYITTRFHTSAYLLHILLDQDISELPWSFYRILGTRREKLVRDAGGDKWILRA
jgi:uncharacterized protein YbjT (DUF2867 family)